MDVSSVALLGVVDSAVASLARRALALEGASTDICTDSMPEKSDSTRLRAMLGSPLLGLRLGLLVPRWLLLALLLTLLEL